MRTLKISIIFLSLTTIWSCSNLTSNKNGDRPAVKDSIYLDTSDVSHRNIKIPKETNNEKLEDTITDIKFKEFNVSINHLIVYDEEKKLNEIQTDTAYIYAELGETIEGQLITISTDILTDLKIEQRYETSVTIMDEGPHCDLIDWKHYNSDWKQLKSRKSGQFICNTYLQKDLEKFPNIKIGELKERVKEQCGKEWLKLISKIKSPTEYPSAVGVSRYFLRLIGKHKDNGQTVTKLIVVEVAMGC